MARDFQAEYNELMIAVLEFSKHMSLSDMEAFAKLSEDRGVMVAAPLVQRLFHIIESNDPGVLDIYMATVGTAKEHVIIPGTKPSTPAPILVPPPRSTDPAYNAVCSCRHMLTGHNSPTGECLYCTCGGFNSPERSCKCGHLKDIHQNSKASPNNPGMCFNSQCDCEKYEEAV